MEGVEEGAPARKGDMSRAEEEYERFLQELEEDKNLRSQINIYKCTFSLARLCPASYNNSTCSCFNTIRSTRS